MSNVIPFRRRQRSIIPDTRTRIEGALALALDAVDHLVTALDELDGDPDLEDGGDAEPSLGAPENHHGAQVIWLRGGDRDLEGA
ncbi:hypothetical protein [Methylobacterium sp. P5_C11]